MNIDIEEVMKDAEESLKPQYSVAVCLSLSKRMLKALEQQQARIEELEKASEWVSVDDIKLLLSFAPKDKPESVPKGLNPMFYFTLSYEGDYDIAVKLKNIRNALPKPPGVNHE